MEASIDGRAAVPVSGATLAASEDQPQQQVIVRDGDGEPTLDSAGGVTAARLVQLLRLAPTSVVGVSVQRTSLPGSVTITGDEVRDGFPYEATPTRPGPRSATFQARGPETARFFRPVRDDGQGNIRDTIDTDRADLVVAIATDGSTQLKPVVSATPTRVAARDVVTLTASAPGATDPACVWTFGDGTPATAPGPCSTTHAYAGRGSYEPSAVVLAADNASGSGTAPAVVVGAAPGGGTATTPAGTAPAPSGGTGGAGTGGGTSPTGGGTTPEGAASGAQAGTTGRPGTGTTATGAPAASAALTPATAAPSTANPTTANRPSTAAPGKRGSPGGGRTSRRRTATTTARPTTPAAASTPTSAGSAGAAPAASTPADTPPAADTSADRRAPTTSTPAEPGAPSAARTTPRRRQAGATHTPAGERVSGVLAAGPGSDLAAALAAADALAAAPAAPVLARAAAGGGDLHLLGVMGGVGTLLALLGIGAARECSGLRGSPRLRPS